MVAVAVAVVLTEEVVGEGEGEGAVTTGGPPQATDLQLVGRGNSYCTYMSSIIITSD